MVSFAIGSWGGRSLETKPFTVALLGQQRYRWSPGKRHFLDPPRTVVNHIKSRKWNLRLGFIWKDIFIVFSSLQGDLDIHIRNASKYDDVRFLHFPRLKMVCSFDWVCLNGANPHDHHIAVPHAPDKIEGTKVSKWGQRTPWWLVNCAGYTPLISPRWKLPLSSRVVHYSQQ